MMIGLYCFTHDLRLQDNPLLLKAIEDCEQLIFLYCLDVDLNNLNTFGMKRVGSARLTFIRECLEDLDQALSEHGQKVILKVDEPINSIKGMLDRHAIECIYLADSPGVYEQGLKQKLESLNVQCVSMSSGALLEPPTFAAIHSDDTTPQLYRFKQFTEFRKYVEKSCQVAQPVSRAKSVPPFPDSLKQEQEDQWPTWHQQVQTFPFSGGEVAAQSHLDGYLSESGGIRRYKETRNHLGEYQSSSMLSTWLSVGAISARQIWQQTEAHEDKYGSNQSTYWLKFELLWREFFALQLRFHQNRFFQFKGLNHRAPLQTYYPEYFMAWREGNTGVPIVDACMKELKATGYLSNRGRQIAASYLVNDMGVDWRFGAAWFEAQLVDYDVASNWGNWMYVAGVGHDPRKDRYFNLKNQCQHYDGQAKYVSQWLPELSALPTKQRHFPFLYSEHARQPVCLPLSMRN